MASPFVVASLDEVATIVVARQTPERTRKALRAGGAAVKRLA